MLSKRDLVLITEIIDEQMGAKVKLLHEEIIRFKDEVLHEIIDLRDDVTILTGYRDMIEDHEQRLGKLEKNPSL